MRQVDVIEHNAAMLSMKKVQLGDENDPLLVCGFTNGTIRLYSISNDARLTLQLSCEKVHGFGVNCLDTVVVAKNSKFFVVSGGDDQAVAVTLIEATSQPSK